MQEKTLRTPAGAMTGHPPFVYSLPMLLWLAWLWTRQPRPDVPGDPSPSRSAQGPPRPLVPSPSVDSQFRPEQLAGLAEDVHPESAEGGSVRSMESLREELQRWKNDAQWLYAYGGLSRADIWFGDLSLEDRRRLVALALLEGDDDTKNVIRHLCHQYPDPRSSGPAPDPDLSDEWDQWLMFLSPRSRAELLAIRERGNAGSAPSRDPATGGIPVADQERIRLLLRTAKERIGAEPVEHAFWILLPPEPAGEARWVGAVRLADRAPTGIRLPSMALFDPSPDERLALLSAMRGMRWILHVHNHPREARESGPLEPSPDDGGFARYWRAQRDALKPRMRFFIVDGTSVLEYARPEGEPIRWEV